MNQSVMKMTFATDADRAAVLGVHESASGTALGPASPLLNGLLCELEQAASMNKVNSAAIRKQA
jgi:hypothetical protein